MANVLFFFFRWNTTAATTVPVLLPHPTSGRRHRRKQQRTMPTATGKERGRTGRCWWCNHPHGAPNRKQPPVDATPPNPKYKWRLVDEETARTRGKKEYSFVFFFWGAVRVFVVVFCCGFLLWWLVGGFGSCFLFCVVLLVCVFVHVDYFLECFLLLAFLCPFVVVPVSRICTCIKGCPLGIFKALSTAAPNPPTTMCSTNTKTRSEKPAMI